MAMKVIGSVQGLWRYPVKSMSGEALTQATIDETGVLGDRKWALKDARAQEIVNCKALPSILTCAAHYVAPPEPGLAVSHAVITLPDGRTVATSDPFVEPAISAVVGRPVTLWPLQSADDTEHYRLRRPFTPEITRQRMGMKPDDPYPDFSAYEPEMIEELQYFATPRGCYKDAYPIHYVTTASLRTLGESVPGLHVEARRFRPNILLDTGNEFSGCPELEWNGFDIIIGDVVLHCGQRTVRCVMPAQPQYDLVAEPGMASALRRLTGFNFGAYCFVREQGEIRIGDSVFLDTRRVLHPIRAIVPSMPADILSHAPPPPVAAYSKMRVVSRTQEATDVISLDLKADPASRYPFLPGQHLTFRLYPPDSAAPLIRSYSISGAQNEDRDYRVTIKRMGVTSSYLHENIQVGDEIEARYPSGHFFLLPHSNTPLVLISNGIGITPLFHMLERVSETNPDRRIFWVHAARNGRAHPFKMDIASCARRLKSFSSLTIYREPDGGDVFGDDYESTAYLTKEDLQPLAAMPGAAIFLCGTPSFMSSARSILVDIYGIDGKNIHSERFGTKHFGAGGKEPGTEPATIRSIHFQRSGIDAEWTSSDGTLLELAEQLDLPVDYGCRFGACQACGVGLIKGQFDYADEEVYAPPGQILLCCAKPTSDLILDL